VYVHTHSEGEKVTSIIAPRTSEVRAVKKIYMPNAGRTTNKCKMDHCILGVVHQIFGNDNRSNRNDIGNLSCLQKGTQVPLR
jgi:hypothetical protein